MIKIIDATLTMLDEYPMTPEEAREMIRLLVGMSVAGIVLSPHAYEVLEGNLPSGAVYYMELPYEHHAADYPGVEWMITSYRDGEGKYIRNVQVNDLSELKNLTGIEQRKNIRVTGLDDLLTYESRGIYDQWADRLKQLSPVLYPEDTYCCATAIAVSYLQFHNQGTVMTTFTGIGNKAATEQVLLSMHIGRRYKPNMNFADMAALRGLFEAITCKKVTDHAPVVGKKVFYIESGVHVDGVLKRPSNYEPYPAELVGAERKVVLGKHSGKASIHHKLESLGDAGDYPLPLLLERVKRISMKKRGEVTDDEFCKILEGFRKPTLCGTLPGIRNK